MFAGAVGAASLASGTLIGGLCGHSIPALIDVIVAVQVLAVVLLAVTRPYNLLHRPLKIAVGLMGIPVDDASVVDFTAVIQFEPSRRSCDVLFQGHRAEHHRMGTRARRP